MATVQLLLAAVVLAASAQAAPGLLPAHAPAHAPAQVIDYYAYPKYNFDYAVKDFSTGDAKSHWESRDGDVVKGAYSVVDADGTIRIVEYTADDHNGFNAVVKRVGHPLPPQPEIRVPLAVAHPAPAPAPAPYHG